MGMTAEEARSRLEELRAKGGAATTTGSRARLEELRARQEAAAQGPTMQQPSETTVADDSILGRVRRFQNKAADVINATVDTGATMATGAIAEPVAGLAGLASVSSPWTAPFVNPANVEERVMNPVRDAMTFQPRTEAGQQTIQTVADTLSPVAEKFEQAERYLGDAAYDATGSPVLAAAAATVPTAAAEAVGIGLGKGGITAPRRMAENRVLKKGVPPKDIIKQTASDIYTEIDNSGVMVRDTVFSELVDKLKAEAKTQGAYPGVTDKSLSAIKAFEDAIVEGEHVSMADLLSLRKVARKASSAVDPGDAQVASMLIDEIDAFIDKAGPESMIIPDGVNPNAVGIKLKNARDLWGRQAKSRVVTDAIEKARNQASGFENGLTIQFRQIVDNPKKAKFFKNDPAIWAAMNQVVKGTFVGNKLKLIGKMGFSEGGATNWLGGTLSSSLAYYYFGWLGVAATVSAGQTGKFFARLMKESNAKFADQVIRAGRDAEKITRAYMDNTPAKLRTPEELSFLLMHPDTGLDLATKGPTIQAAAIRLAKQRRAELTGAVAAGTELPEEY